MHRLRRVRGCVSERIGHAFHRGKSFASCLSSAGSSGTNHSGSENGARDGCRRFRQLHEHLRMRSRLSGRDQRQLHRQIKSRVRTREFASRVAHASHVLMPVRLGLSASCRNNLFFDFRLLRDEQVHSRVRDREDALGNARDASATQVKSSRTRTSKSRDRVLRVRAWPQDRHLHFRV